MALSAAQPSPWCRCRIRQMSRRCRGLRWLRQAPRRFRFRPCESRVLLRSFQRRKQSRRRPRRVPRPPLGPTAIEPADPCVRDETRLARLRSNPVPDEIVKLQREVACSRLRPQVQRLFESYVGDTTPSPGVNAAPQPVPRQHAQNEPVRAEDACTRDTARLARLRASRHIRAITNSKRNWAANSSGPSSADCARAPPPDPAVWTTRDRYWTRPRGVGVTVQLTS
jgi:hypothetical protein